MPSAGLDRCYLIRAESDRCLVDGGKLRAAVEGAPVLAEAEFDLPGTTNRTARHIQQELRAAQVILKAPHRTDRTLPDITVTVVLAREVNPLFVLSRIRADGRKLC